MVNFISNELFPIRKFISRNFWQFLRSKKCLRNIPIHDYTLILDKRFTEMLVGIDHFIMKPKSNQILIATGTLRSQQYRSSKKKKFCTPFEIKCLNFQLILRVAQIGNLYSAIHDYTKKNIVHPRRCNSRSL